MTGLRPTPRVPMIASHHRSFLKRVALDHGLESSVDGGAA
jgi:hypothetical protein